MAISSQKWRQPSSLEQARPKRKSTEGQLRLLLTSAPGGSGFDTCHGGLETVRDLDGIRAHTSRKRNKSDTQLHFNKHANCFYSFRLSYSMQLQWPEIKGDKYPTRSSFNPWLSSSSPAPKRPWSGSFSSTTFMVRTTLLTTALPKIVCQAVYSNMDRCSFQ